MTSESNRLGLLKRLTKFVTRRNASEYQTNLQFGFDLEECGLKLSDIGKAYRWENPNLSGTGWRWYIPDNDGRPDFILYENNNGKMWIEDQVNGNRFPPEIKI